MLVLKKHDLFKCTSYGGRQLMRRNALQREATDQPQPEAEKRQWEAYKQKCLAEALAGGERRQRRLRNTAMLRG